MGWSIGYDEKWKRDIGYGVPAVCDHPDCNEKINRGISFVCGGEAKGGNFGCGLYFCDNHQHNGIAQLCDCCKSVSKRRKGITYTPKPDTKEWISFKLTDESWQQWRDEHKDEVRELIRQFYDVKSGQELIEEPARVDWD